MTGKNPINGRFMAGNRFWEARSSAGIKPIFDSPEPLRKACTEYFRWNADNPLLEDTLVAYKGTVTHEPLARMRAMTLHGLCQFLDVTAQSWGNWRRGRPDLEEVIEWAESVIYRQKFEGASADMLNASIIARELGLADRRELTGKDGGPIVTEDVTRDADHFARRMASLQSSLNAGGAGNADPATEGGA